MSDLDDRSISYCAPQDVVPSGLYALSDRVGGRQHVDSFVLDRYPVTVDRFARFVQAGGYEDDSYWDHDGWRWRIDNTIDAPRFWGDTNWPLWRRFLRPTRPVIGVSWHEAVAFCSFEGRRLPTEVEWEAAARGPEGRIYPWGDHWQEGRIGGRGVGPRVTWPVGYFPQSVAPFGHHDMVGNVWQWMQDDLQTSSGRDAKVVRGGSWASRPEQNRTDHINGYALDGRHSHVGFRTIAL